MFNYFKAFLGYHLGNEEGQGMVEYALILVLIADVAIVALSLVGIELGTVFTNIQQKLINAPSGT